MGYVTNLLNDHLDSHTNELIHQKSTGQHENVAHSLKVISEIEHVLKLLKYDEPYQRY